VEEEVATIVVILNTSMNLNTETITKITMPIIVDMPPQTFFIMP